MGPAAQASSKRWRAWYPVPNGTHLSARTEDDYPLTFLTKSDARAWLNRVHDSIARGEWEPPAEAVARCEREAAEAAARDVTFADYAERWLERIASEPGKGGRLRKPATVMMYRGRVNNYLRGPLGDTLVREVDTAVVRDLARELVAIPSRLRPGTTHNGIAGDAIDVLKMILRAAVHDGVLAAMPDVATPQRKSVRHDQDHAPEDDVATPTQVEALHAAIPQPWSIAVLLAAWVPPAPRGGARAPAPRHRVESLPHRGDVACASPEERLVGDAHRTPSPRWVCARWRCRR
ncbi:hypothetical protein Slu03_05950 [Sediminihabitans luteus]|uniref:hypothetical protein n=1 Tax=Sediminihabitans luteus TaxID=1138585 RepID=UPI00194FBC6D|nr:hypothetical protein [Sediminihabitans luteus]GII98217.1 hypothetical protein Slu03_05950 [Sediminihabitans luteus]